MKVPIPRLRMFAGPNGSGKSTLKSYLPPELLGVYINADDLERSIRENGYLDLSAYRVQTEAEEILDFFRQAPLLHEKALASEVSRLTFSAGCLAFNGVRVNGYFASVASDFIRQKLLERKITFTFETVMSHESKLQILKQAQALGYRTYLYYVATEDPDINVDRVRYRVTQGGHDVPEEKIRSRYTRSLANLLEAIRHTNRAYIWDNSGDDPAHNTMVAEITEGHILEWRTQLIPAWFKRAVLDSIQATKLDLEP